LQENLGFFPTSAQLFHDLTKNTQIDFAFSVAFLEADLEANDFPVF
jgi:hypothetical protein